jgi:sugar phosphate isomerase/epimerase
MFPFRLGTTSYIIPDDILPNVRYLADKVQDVELVLFEVDDGANNLPTPEVVAELQALAEAHGLTYTVHLPLDLRLGADGDEGHVSLVKARAVIERTRALNPWAYVLHLDGRELLAAPGPETAAAWRNQAVRALELALGWAGGPERLAVENLERYPLDFWTPVLERVPVARCVDIGHLWLDHHDPLPFLGAALSRTRVVHLHGVAQRDHQSLSHVLPEKLDPVMDYLCEAYKGVLTLEVFSEADFHSSVAALEASLSRRNTPSAKADGCNFK